MSTTIIDKWIRQSLENDPPRSKSVTMTLFGDSIAPHGGNVWLGSLIALLTPFGISDRLVRTSVFRLAEEGWLESRREGRRSAYALTKAGLRRIGHAYRRIYARPDEQWLGAWTLVIGAPGALSATERATLRKELLWEGFSMVAAGVFAHPAGDPEGLEEILGRTGLANKLYLCQANELSLPGSRRLCDLVKHGWQLDPIKQGYQRFIANFGPLVRLLDVKNAIRPEQSFVIRTLLMHTFRRIQLHDPLLPMALLPENWPGTAAYELCREIYRLTYTGAEQHLITLLSQEDENTTMAGPGFYLRFGGLT